MASYSNTTQEVHVLLVEHDTNHLISTMQLLEFFSYKAKCIDHASTALSMLSNGKAQFDIVMANVNSPDTSMNSPDTSTFELLQEAVKMDLLVILMYDYDDDMVARSALEQGAFLFLAKPIKIEDVKYLWQHVWREKTWKIKEKEQIGEGPVFNRMSNGFGAEGEIPLENIMNDDDDVAENGSKSREKGRKVWAEWTQELHDKFVDAIIELGEGRCYPKEILELMDVPGLTRLQVASHLQKCRKGRWRQSKETKGHYASPEIKATNLKRKKFGSMPFLTKHFEQQNLLINENRENIQDPHIYSLTNKNIFDYHPQVESQKNLSGFTFSQDNVEAPYMEQDGTNLLKVPGAFMPNEPFMFDFDSVTSGDLQAFDIDRPNEPGWSHGALTMKGHNRDGVYKWLSSHVASLKPIYVFASRNTSFQQLQCVNFCF